MDTKNREEEDALRLARELRRQVSDLRDQAKAVGEAIAGQAPAPSEDPSSDSGSSGVADHATIGLNKRS